MKDIKTEKIKSTASDYLKLRSFELVANGNDDFDALMPKQVGLTPEEKVGLKEILSPSSPNSFTFSTTSSQYNFIEQQYIRLKSWMTEASEPCRSELSQVLFPLFVHLYLDLLMGAGKQPAKFFFGRHHQVFRVNREYELTLKQIWNASGEAISSPVVQSLKSGKYLVRLSEVTLHYFLRYLQTSNNPTLLQIFNNFLEVELSEGSGSQSQPQFKTTESSDPNNEDQASCSTSDAKKFDCTAEDLFHVKEVIRNVRSSKPLMPSLAIYNVFNAYNGLTCAKINSDSRLLVCGFEDSVIKLWRLTPPHNHNPPGFHIEAHPPKKESDKILFCDLMRGEREEKFTPPEKEEEEEFKSLGGRHVSGGEFCTLRGHRGAVFDAAFTHCSSYLLSVGDDASMRLWNVEDQRVVSLYYGHHYPIWCLDESQHSIYVITGSYDETLRLWSLEFTHPLRTFVGHCGSVDSVAFHPNCSYVASGSDDKSVRLWQVNDASVARVLLHHSDPIKSLKFSPDGKFLASGSGNGEAVIWDLSAGKVLHQVGSHTSAAGSGTQGGALSGVCDSVVSLDWSKDSRVLYSASSDGTVRGTYLKNLKDYDTSEIGDLFCGANGASSTLIHTSLNSHNYLQSVVTVHGER